MSAAIINQAWEDVANDVTSAIEKAVQPLLKRAVDDIYSGLLDETQNYLKDNLAFNIASRIDTAEREATTARQENERLKIENAILSKAVHWYANPDIYKPHPHGPAFDRRDVSFVAIDALARLTNGGQDNG